MSQELVGCKVANLSTVLVLNTLVYARLQLVLIQAIWVDKISDVLFKTCNSLPDLLRSFLTRSLVMGYSPLMIGKT